MKPPSDAICDAMFPDTASTDHAPKLRRCPNRATVEIKRSGTILNLPQTYWVCSDCAKSIRVRRSTMAANETP